MSDNILQELSKPFAPSAISWLPGSIKKDGTAALALAYADLRAYMNRLDEVCGLNWSVSYTPWGSKLICHLTVDGVTRSSIGEPTDESERGEIEGTVTEAQAFKRACVMFGLGRYLYTFPQSWQPIDSYKKFTKEAEAKLMQVVMSHYDRTVGKATPTTHRQPEPAGVDVDFGMGESNPFDDQTVGAQAEPAAATVDPALQKKLNILNSLGNTFYNKRKGDDAWDKKREEIAKPFGVTSSTALTGAQIDTLIAGLEKRTREIIAQMGGIPADIVTECTAFGKFAGVDSIDQARGVGLAKCLQWAKANSVPAFSAKPTTLYA